jgi:cytosine/creatinine deaminase
MQLQGYGIEPGCDASFVLLEATDAVDAVRLRANRLRVWKRGKCLSERAETTLRLNLG